MLARSLFLAAVTAALVAGTASAGSVSGTITAPVTFDTLNVPGVQVGSIVHGSYTYDNSQMLPGTGFTVNPFTAFSLTIGSRTFGLSDLQMGGGLTPGRIIQTSTPTVDELYFFINQQTYNSFLGVGPNDVASLGLGKPQNYTELVPPSGPELFTFEITATPNAVPEPGSLTLLAVCAAGLGVGAWRRRVI
jgi:hypothetical protein